MSVKKIISYNGYKGTFEVGEPIGGKLSKDKFDGVNKGRLKVPKGEGSGIGVSTNLGTKVNRRKRAIRLDPNVMEDISLKGSDEEDWVGVEVRDAWEESEEVMFNEFFLRDPEFLTVIIYNGILIRVTVDSVGASRGVEEVGKEVCYRYL